MADGIIYSQGSVLIYVANVGRVHIGGVINDFCVMCEVLMRF